LGAAINAANDDERIEQDVAGEEDEVGCDGELGGRWAEEGGGDEGVEEGVEGADGGVGVEGREGEEEAEGG
jgi:hypothetical protein